MIIMVVTCKLMNRWTNKQAESHCLKLCMDSYCITSSIYLRRGRLIEIVLELLKFSHPAKGFIANVL